MLIKTIEAKNYAEDLIDDDMTTILKYGIACRRRTCMVRKADSSSGIQKFVQLP